jgi:prepilin-type N-terminal cleavage/methylation domain-containing protein
MMNQTKTQSEAGFTLIETVISMVLMAIVGLGVASMFAYAASSTANAGDREMATAVAQQRMEQLKSVAFTDATLNVTSSTGVTTTVTRLGREYSVNTAITANANATLKTITIKVTPVASSAKSVSTIFGSVTLVSTRGTQQLGSNRSY